MQFKQARSPASTCLQRTQQSLAARPSRKGRTLARLGIVAREHQVLARLILLARVSTPAPAKVQYSSASEQILTPSDSAS
jgi:hypothetical protein